MRIAAALIASTMVTACGRDPTPACREPVSELPSIALEDCDGNTRDLAELNTPKSSWLYLFTGWCGACQDRAESAPVLAEDIDSPGFAAFFVITQDDQYNKPSHEYCAATRDRFALPMPVLVDPEDALPQTLNVPVNAVDVVTHCGEIVLQESYANEGDVFDVIESALQD